MSKQTILSICKSAAYGETAEQTAIHHGITADEVKAIWEANPDIIIDYQNFYREMGCIK